MNFSFESEIRFPVTDDELEACAEREPEFVVGLGFFGGTRRFRLGEHARSSQYVWVREGECGRKIPRIKIILNIGSQAIHGHVNSRAAGVVKMGRREKLKLHGQIEAEPIVHFDVNDREAPLPKQPAISGGSRKSGSQAYAEKTTELEEQRGFGLVFLFIEFSILRERSLGVVFAILRLLSA